MVAEATAGRSPLSVYENSRYALQVVGGVSVTVPLYAGGAIASREREAIQRNIAAQFGVEEARRAVRSDIAANWSAVTDRTDYDVPESMNAEIGLYLKYLS